MIRGICCLRPGVPGFSENIQVRSVVGRFLEHSRVFRFGNSGDTLVYISSGDWMQRNFFSRVEIMTPVEDELARKRLLDEVLEPSWIDGANSWELRSDGTWKHRTSVHGQVLDSHSFLIQQEQRLAHPSAPPSKPLKRTGQAVRKGGRRP
jgi:polyphosphate kinase